MAECLQCPEHDAGTIATHHDVESRIGRPLLTAGMVALLTGLFAGLVRIGWGVPLPIAPATTATRGA